MTVLCVIPARGGSKGVPRKNVRRVGGLSLVARAVRSALASSLVDAVLVSTDDDEIEQQALLWGADVVHRPAELAADESSSESALLHALEAFAERTGSPADVMVFLQCTSPFIDPADIDRAVEMVTEDGYDAVFSAVRSHAFIWRVTDDRAAGVNHDWHVRERRQDRPVEFRETGAIYVMRVPGFVESGHRFFGRVGVCEVPETHGVDIDSEHDLVLARVVAERDEALAALDPSRVDALVMDFDGVHTNNVAIVDERGGESVVVNRSDGLGLAALRRAGLPMLILSTERNAVVTARAEKLGIECIQAVEDKLAVLRSWSQRHAIDPARIVYVGNDANDLECLNFVGWPVVVADAHPSVRQGGAMVTRRGGGDGALREIADRLLRDSGPTR